MVFPNKIRVPVDKGFQEWKKKHPRNILSNRIAVLWPSLAQQLFDCIVFELFCKIATGAKIHENIGKKGTDHVPKKVLVKEVKRRMHKLPTCSFHWSCLYFFGFRNFN